MAVALKRYCDFAVVHAEQPEAEYTACGQSMGSPIKTALGGPGNRPARPSSVGLRGAHARARQHGSCVHVRVYDG
eukprot:5920989-Alexandrium_andersonii.AAC.1